MPFNRQHALITGGSRGIGRGIALKLAENGVKVGVHYYRNESAANEQPAGAGSGSHQKLAQTCLDSNGTAGHAGRHWQCCGVILL
jgi:NAD(P)-dependent dehydrogenase (short-subunit alcohol dehydrogenase family)